MLRRFVAILIALLAFSLQLGAVKAWPYPVTVVQPDGSTLAIRIVGDENWSCKTTMAGRPVYQDAQGFWHETDSVALFPQVRKQLSPEGGALTAFFATKSPVSVRTLVIPVQFSDRSFSIPNPRSSIYNLFNQQNYSEYGATGSVLDYFRDNLDDRGQLIFDVCDVVTLPYTMAYYGENAEGVNDRNLRQLVQHACIAADAAGVDFSLYDFNKDGFVDNVFLIVAGHNEAEGGGDYTIWPQSWNIADAGLTIDGKRVSNFSVCSELSGSSGYRFTGIGTICHEFCHFLGLPDLYDINGSTEGEGPGLCGTLSIMDQGNYNNEGRTPPYLTIFERHIIGLVSMMPIRSTRHLTITPVQYATQAWVLPTTVTGEEFWIEYRTGLRWDSYIGGTGLVVYHVDRSNNSAGSMPAKMRWETNAVNGAADHPCVRFIASTGETPASVADAFYPGAMNVRDIRSSVNFPLVAWNGQGLGLGLAEIGLGVEGMNCQVVSDNGWDLPVVTGWSIIPGQTSAYLSWEADKVASGEWNIIWGGRSIIQEQRVIVGSRTSYLFENLEPDESYYCELFYTLRNLEGKHYHMEFRSVQRLSDYPLIGGLEAGCRVGVPVYLSVLNLVEEGASVTWYINGESVKDLHHTFERAGMYKVEAVINYADGSYETLTKILEVKE